MSGNQQYGGFDEVNIGHSLSLTSSDLVLQTSDNVDYNRLARSVYDQVIASNCEFIFYSPLYIANTIATLPTLGTGLTPTLMVGIVTSAANLNKFIGIDPNGFGYNPADGNVLNNAVAVANIGTATFGDVIGMLVDPANALLYFFKNGVAMNTTGIAITANKSWFAAATVSGVPGTVAINFNPGNTPFRYPLNKLTGWWAARQGITPLNLSTEPYMGAGTDAAPYEKYAGDINPIASVTTIFDSVKFWMFGNSAPGELGAGGLVQMEVDDPNGIYTDLTSDTIRNNQSQIWRNRSDQDMTHNEVLFTGVFDHCSQDNRQTKQIFFRDQRSRLNVAIKRALFAPDAEAQVAGKPRPVSMGVCRNYVPELYDSKKFLYALHDGPIAAYGRVRLAGKQIVYGADFTATTDLGGIDMLAAPAGVLLVESTDVGGAFSAASSDYTLGAGTFTTIGTLGGGPINDINGGSLAGSSSTSKLIATGAGQTFTMNAPSSCHFANGSQILLTATAGAVGTMQGTVTSYASPTLTVNVTAITGSGTGTAWSVTGGVNQPTGWSCAGGYPNDLPTALAQVIGTAPNQAVRFAQEADGIQWFWPGVNVVLHQNHSYAFKIVCNRVPYYGRSVDANGGISDCLPGYLVFSYYKGGLINNVQFIRIPLQLTSTTDGVWQDGVSVTLSGIFINNTGADRNMVIGYLPNAIIQGGGGTFSYLDIASITMNELPAIADNVTFSGGPGLTAMMNRINVVHGPLDPSELVTADTDAIDVGGTVNGVTVAATNYTYGVHVNSGETPTNDQLTQQLMDSVCSALYNNEAGKFRVGRLYAPENVADGNLSGVLTLSDVMGEVICYPDLAENLTTRANACRNYNPMAGGDYGQTSLSDCPALVRAQLAQDYQFTATAGIQLAYRYQNAYNRDPLKTLLDLQADAQDEIVYANKLYTVPRNFYVGKFFEPVTRSFKLMQCWKLTYPLPTLANGTKLVLLGRQREPHNEICTLIFWGM